MRIGLLGDPKELQINAVRRELHVLGRETVDLDSSTLDRGAPLSFLDGVPFLGRQSLADVRAVYVKGVPSPMPPVMEKDGAWHLFDGWFDAFMQKRERSSVFISWLLEWQQAGVKLVNPPHAGSMLQFKPFQLAALRAAGARVPRTLISNDPEAIRAFHAEVKNVIFKPVMGGAITQRLDERTLPDLERVKASPVIFQECAPGDDLRVMCLGGEIVSSVAIVTPEQHLDFRDDPVYSGGGAQYREVELPAAVKAQCAEAARRCGLEFAGIDIKHQGDDWVFLELNSSPIYLDVELKLGHRISAAIAQRLCTLAG